MHARDVIRPVLTDVESCMQAVATDMRGVQGATAFHAMLVRRCTPAPKTFALQPDARHDQLQNAVQLIRRIAQDQDRDAFTQLFSLFGPKVKSYLLRHGAVPQQAEDLAQETLISVWRKAGYYDPARASPAAWIYTIARNLRIDALRHERAVLVYDEETEDQPDDAPAADEELVSAERDLRVRTVMRNLPQEQSEVLRMSFFQDKPHAEIARELQLPLGTVKSRVRLALARLRATLGENT